jgi:hypothetical protein
MNADRIRAKYDVHVKLCMGFVERPEKPPVRRNPMPKLVYNLLKVWIQIPSTPVQDYTVMPIALN